MTAFFPNTLRGTCTAALLAAGALAAWPAAAQTAATSAPRPNYAAERAMCDNIQQDRAACIREAGAAAQAARQGNLTHASAETYRQNALQRCTLQPAQDRAACEQRVLGTGATTVEGSVMGGGTLREAVTPVPATSVTPTTGQPLAPAVRPINPALTPPPASPAASPPVSAPAMPPSPAVTPAMPPAMSPGLPPPAMPASPQPRAPAVVQ